MIFNVPFNLSQVLSLWDKKMGQVGAGKRMWDLKRGQEVSPLQGMSSMFGTKGICWDLALSAKKSSSVQKNPTRVNGVGEVASTGAAPGSIPAPLGHLMGNKLYCELNHHHSM